MPAFPVPKAGPGAPSIAARPQKNNLEREVELGKDTARRRTGGEDALGQAGGAPKLASRPPVLPIRVQCGHDGSRGRAVVDVIEEVQSLNAEVQVVLTPGAR